MTFKGKRDFTVSMYQGLLDAFLGAGYAFQTFEDYCRSPGDKSVILRHDVDRAPQNSLKLAQIEAGKGIRASYHFRATGSSDKPDIIMEIAALGHEVGYHYEDISFIAGSKGQGRTISQVELAAEAFNRFRSNLEYFRQFYPVQVISMHGSPTVRIDNRLVWKYYDYRDCGIICEPYFDIDYSDMLYLTDTGRRWDGERYSVRDRAIAADSLEPGGGFSGWKVKPVSGSLLNMTNEGLALRSNYKVHSTKEILILAESGVLPERIVINTHPQRWNDSYPEWMWELIAQALKNRLKKLVIRLRALRTIN